MKTDTIRTVQLLIQHRKLITPSKVVSQFKAAKDDDRELLHRYLHALFEADHDAGKDFHDMQVYLENFYNEFT